MTRRPPIPGLRLLPFALVCALVPAAGFSQAIIKVNDDINFRFGLILQPTYEAVQDANSEGYSQNWYIRRVRFMMAGNIGKNIQLFFQTDNPRVGNAGVTGGDTKAFNSGFLIQDAYVQWGFLGSDAIQLQTGEFLVPTVRQPLTSVATFLGLDLPTWTFQQNTALKGNGGRDYGVGLNGFLLGDHLSYRMGVFDGFRNPPTTVDGVTYAGSRNPPRIAGRIQYDFFDPEKGYSYVGTNLGKKKVLAIAFTAEGQGDYKGIGGDAFFDFPIGKNAVTLEGDYLHYDGHREFATIPEQETFYTNAGFYFDDFKLQPFVRYEKLNFGAITNQPKEQERVGGGVNFYVMGQNLKITPYYERIIPKVQPAVAMTKDTNRFVVQIQGFYF
jgi:Phosphate-selective porin O and P